MRIDGRSSEQLRPVNLILDFIQFPEGSVLIKQGNTHVLCNVTIEENIPRWMQTQNIPGGWVTADYSMLPRATPQRTPRETNGLSGRTQEIKRLIGRSLRAGVDLTMLGSRTKEINQSRKNPTPNSTISGRCNKCWYSRWSSSIRFMLSGR